MKLSKLIYLAVKNVIYFDDMSFTYEAFLQGSFDEDPDYSINIQNAFSPLNEALSRLSDLERIPYRVETLENIVNGIADLSNLSHKVKEVISVAQTSGNRTLKIVNRPFGVDKVMLASPYNRRFPVYIEYKEDLPVFSRDDFEYYTLNDEGLPELLPADQIRDIELNDYGISNSMCNYLMEYMAGRLNEPTAAELANMHITRAEQYFNNIAPVHSAFAQEAVQSCYKIGE